MRKKKSRMPDFPHAVPIIMLTAVALCLITAVAAALSGRVRLYKEIGATPMHRPEIKVSAESSERFSDEEIQSAIAAAAETYEQDWYTFNGVYLLKLVYNDEFSESRRSENEGDWIYLNSVVFTGYGKDVLPENMGVYHYDTYWAVERLEDGSWLCHGCGQM